MEKHYLYLVLTRTNTVMSRAIQLIKKDEYTHAAIALDDNLYYMYSFGRKYIHNPFIGSFKQENLHKGLYKYNQHLPVMIMEIEVSQQQYDKANQILDQLIVNHKKYKYNYKGLFYCLLNKPACCENRFLCSEFVYYILKECDIIDFKMPGNLVRPQSLTSMTSRIVYEGSIENLDLAGNHSPEQTLAL